MLVRVLTDNGGPKPVGLIAQVVEERDGSYVIQYLSSTDDTYKGRKVYRYEIDTYEIDDDYIIEFMDDEAEVGYTEVPDGGGWIKTGSTDADESDEDYVPSDEEEQEDEEDEEEDIENEDYEDYAEDYDDE